MAAYRKQQSSFAKGDTVKSTESVRDLLSDSIEHVHRESLKKNQVIWWRNLEDWEEKF